MKQLVHTLRPPLTYNQAMQNNNASVFTNGLNSSLSFGGVYRP